MKHKLFSDEQVIGVLKEHKAGAKVDDICRRHAISTATFYTCLLYTSPSPRDGLLSRMPSSA